MKLVLVGMGIQATLTALLSAIGAITVSPEQQLFAASIFFLVALIAPGPRIARGVALFAASIFFLVALIVGVVELTIPLIK